MQMHREIRDVTIISGVLCVSQAQIKNCSANLLRVEDWEVIVARGRVSTHCVTEADKKRPCLHSVNCREPFRHENMPQAPSRRIAKTIREVKIA